MGASGHRRDVSRAILLRVVISHRPIAPVPGSRSVDPADSLLRHTLGICDVSQAEESAGPLFYGVAARILLGISRECGRGASVNPASPRRP